MSALTSALGRTSASLAGSSTASAISKPHLSSGPIKLIHNSQYYRASAAAFSGSKSQPKRHLHTSVANLDRNMEKFQLAKKYHGLERNVWWVWKSSQIFPSLLRFPLLFRVEFIALALETKPLNLGQGFPDDLIPDYVPKTLSEVVNDPSIFMHQYTRGHVSFGSSSFCKFSNTNDILGSSSSD